MAITLATDLKLAVLLADGLKLAEATARLAAAGGNRRRARGQCSPSESMNQPRGHHAFNNKRAGIAPRSAWRSSLWLASLPLFARQDDWRRNRRCRVCTSDQFVGSAGTGWSTVPRRVANAHGPMKSLLRLCSRGSRVCGRGKADRVLAATRLRENICGPQVRYSYGSGARRRLDAATASCSTGWA
jgi:hypothetical protein